MKRLQIRSLTIAAVVILLVAGCFAREPRIVAGAIRWDAWHGKRSAVGQAVESSLGPAKWHSRLPFFARVDGDDSVAIDGATQAVLDSEIAYARQARLDYWAFLLYQPGSAMNLPLAHYVSSRKKRGLQFCLILEQSQWTSADAARPQFEQVAELMARREYQTVLDQRPLLYIIAAEPGSPSWGSRRAREAVDELRVHIGRKGVREPYVVILDWRPAHSSALRQTVNADAIGAYAFQRDGKDAPYSQLASETEGFWEECKQTGSAVVPIVMSGWDRRPRVERPVFWETWQQPGAGLEKFYRKASLDELTSHLRRAVQWVDSNRMAAAARAILIYAWNENDEGGWLVPTLGDGTSRLKAVRTALRR